MVTGDFHKTRDITQGKNREREDTTPGTAREWIRV